MSGVAQAEIDGLRQGTVLFRVGGVVIVEIHQKVGEVGAVLGLHVGDQLLRGDAFLLGA